MATSSIYNSGICTHKTPLPEISKHNPPKLCTHPTTVNPTTIYWYIWINGSASPISLHLNQMIFFDYSENFIHLHFLIVINNLDVYEQMTSLIVMLWLILADCWVIGISEILETKIFWAVTGNGGGLLRVIRGN